MLSCPEAKALSQGPSIGFRTRIQDLHGPDKIQYMSPFYFILHFKRFHLAGTHLIILGHVLGDDKSCKRNIYKIGSTWHEHKKETIFGSKIKEDGGSRYFFPFLFLFFGFGDSNPTLNISDTYSSCITTQYSISLFTTSFLHFLFWNWMVEPTDSSPVRFVSS